MELVTYIAAFIFIVTLIVAGAWFLKTLSGDKGKPIKFFGNKEKRIGVVQSASVDGRRKLILIKRDDVEHLIMTGGAVDVLIENNIRNNRPAISDTNTEVTDSRSHSEIDALGDNVKDG